MTPAVVMRPIWSLLARVNHSAPSGPLVMPCGYLMPCRGLATGNWKVVMTPAVVMRPIWSPLARVNHRAPSGPAVMPMAPPPAPNSATTAGTQRYYNCSRVKATRRGRLPFRREEADHQRPNRLFIVDLFKGHQGCALVMWPLETQVLLRPPKAATSIYGSPPWR